VLDREHVVAVPVDEVGGRPIGGLVALRDLVSDALRIDVVASIADSDGIDGQVRSKV
jgi:hypothetical protein